MASYQAQARQSTGTSDGPEPMDNLYDSTPENERPRSDGKCYRCGKPDHIARNCRVFLSSRQQTQGVCSDATKVISSNAPKGATSRGGAALLGSI
ncbi:putative Zinc finger, CCHC-type [Plasmopara halstedii]